MKKISILPVMAALFLSIFLLAGCGGAAVSSQSSGDSQTGSGEPIRLILGHCDPEDPNDPLHATSIAFKEKVEELSGGSIQVTVYPNAQLGDERTVVESVQNGTVDVTVVTNTVASNFQPLAKLMDLPFLFENVEQAREITGGPIGSEIMRSMSDVGIRGLGYTENGFRFILNNKHEVIGAEDLAGLKLRVMQSPVYLSFYNSLGASPIPLAYGELYTAVSQGTVDGFDLTLPLVISSKFYEVSEYMSDVRYTYTSLMVLMNEEKFSAYPREVQEILLAATDYARQFCFDTNDEVMANGFDFLEGKVQIKHFDQIDFAGFRAASEEIWQEHADSEQAKELLGQLVTATQQ